MWKVTLSGHNPTNPNDVRRFDVRGATLRTLSTRVRSLTGWTYVHIERLPDGSVRLRPSGGREGMALALPISNPSAQPCCTTTTNPVDTAMAAFLRHVDTALLVQELARRETEAQAADPLGTLSISPNHVSPLDQGEHYDHQDPTQDLATLPGEATVALAAPSHTEELEP